MLNSFETGLVQAKAYRILNNNITKLLSNYNLSQPEWALLGNLSIRKDGLRFVDIANLLDVKPSFVTQLVDKLEKKGLTTRQAVEGDRRALHVLITKKGIEITPIIEKEIKHEMKNILSGVSLKDLLTYLSVLEKIIKNDDLKGGEINE